MNKNFLFLPFLGLFLAAMAAAVGSSFSSIPWLATLLWGLAGAAVVLWITLDLKNFKRFFMRKGSKYGASSGAAIVLGVLIIAGVSILSTKPRFNKSFDVTRSGANTLSDQSIKIIDNLKEKNTNLEIVAFFQDEGPKTSFQNLIQLYESKGLQAKVEYKDPQTDPTDAIAEKITQGNTVIFKQGSQSTRITTFSEEKVTNAIINVMKDKTKTIYFTKGHGEGELEGSGADGFKVLSDNLKSNKYDVAELPLLEKADIPENADLLVIAGPKYDFKDEEIKLLEQYVAAAKPLVVMVDAMVPVPKLNAFLKDYGISFNDDLLILSPEDPRAQLLGQNNAIVSTFDDYNAITKDFARKSNVALLMPNTRSVLDNASNPHKMTVSLVAKTSNVIVGISDVKTQADLKNLSNDRVKRGEFGVVAVATGLTAGPELAHNDQDKKDQKADVKPNQTTKSKELRIVAVGSTEFANNMGAQRGENMDMFTNIANYLLQDEDFISIRPKDAAKSSIELTTASSQLTLMFLTYIFPFVFLGFGIVHWLKRRRA